MTHCWDRGRGRQFDSRPLHKLKKTSVKTRVETVVVCICCCRETASFRAAVRARAEGIH